MYLGKHVQIESLHSLKTVCFVNYAFPLPLPSAGPPAHTKVGNL